MLVLIGSRALAYHLNRDKFSDTDLIGSYTDLTKFFASVRPVEQYPLGPDRLYARDNNSQIYEGEIAWSGSTGAQFIQLVLDDPYTTFQIRNGFDVLLPGLDALYALKMSHRYLRNSPHFRKTMTDIHEMRRAGARIRPEYQDWYKARMADTYKYQHPNLKRTKAEFFSADGVEYVYDHDSLHEAVALGVVPAYRLFQVDGEQVLSSREKFEDLSEENKQNAVLEECYVLALERSQIPFPQMDPRRSFEIALEKVCTSITSGWFREYAWENFDAIDARYEPEYIGRFKAALAAGIVRKAA